MNDIKVSVIMPVLNSANFIKESIESVLKQSLKHIELLCVDAGSTDGTIDIINEISQKDNRVKIIKSSKKSYGYQINIGIENAMGECIGIVESDDQIMPDMYNDLYNIYKNIKCDFIKCDFYKFKIKDKFLIKEYVKIINNSGDYNTIINIQQKHDYAQTSVVPWTGIYNKKFLQDNAIKLNESEGASFQDCGLAFQCNMFSTKMMFVNKAYYMYRQDNPNSSIYDLNKLYTMNDEYMFIWNCILANRNKIGLYWIIPYYITKFYEHCYDRMWKVHYKNREQFLFRFREDIKYIIENEFAKPYWWKSKCFNLINMLIDDFEAYKKYIYINRHNLFTKLELANNIIIYGAGRREKCIVDVLKYTYLQGKILGFAVDYIPKENEKYAGYNIKSIMEYQAYNEKALVLMVASKKEKKKMIENVSRLGFRNIAYSSVADKIYSQTLPENYKTTVHNSSLTSNYIYDENFEKLKIAHDFSHRIINIQLNSGAFRKYFEDKNISNVIVYGLGVYGKILIKMLRQANVNIVAVVDSNVDNYEELSVLKPNDNFPNFDKLIISTLEFKNDIRDISINQNRMKIISFSEILDYIESNILPYNDKEKILSKNYKLLQEKKILIATIKILTN